MAFPIRSPASPRKTPNTRMRIPIGRFSAGGSRTNDRRSLILSLTLALLLLAPAWIVIGQRAEGTLSGLDEKKMMTIHLYGTPRERGVQYGLVACNEIRQNLDIFWKAVRNQGVSKSELVDKASERSLSQGMTEELRGLSESSGVEYSELLAFNEFCPSVAHGGCTCFVARGDVTLDGNPLSFKTMDYAGLGEGIQEVLVIVKPEEGNGYMGVTIAGAVGLSCQGINDKGLMIGYNWLPVPKYYESGLTPWEMQELVLEECGSVDDAITLAYAMPKHEGVNLMVSDSEESAFIETAPSVYSPNVSYKIITSGFDVHTNHWLYEPFLSWVLDGWSYIWTRSVSRYDRAMGLGAEYEGELTASLLISFTRDLEHWSNSPKGVMDSHPEYSTATLWNGQPGNSICNAATRSACVFEISKRYPTMLSTMWMALNNPCCSPFVPLHNAILYDAGSVAYADGQLTSFLSMKAYQLAGALKKEYPLGALVPTYVGWEAGIAEQTSANEVQAEALLNGGSYGAAASFLTEVDCSIALQAFDLQLSLV